MFLDTVNINGMPLTPGPGKTVVFAPWQNCAYTHIHHHGAACCEIAKAWFLSMDNAQLGGKSAHIGPRWIRERYQWGPSKHPIYWCEAVRQKTLDCGVLAAMAHECFASRGIRSFPVQLVQQYSLEATVHWKEQWQEKDTPVNWIKDDVIYHEGNAVLLRDGNIKLWDASAAWWMNPSLTTGYGSLSALRLHDAKAGPDVTYNWGEHKIKPNVWQHLVA